MTEKNCFSTNAADNLRQNLAPNNQLFLSSAYQAHNPFSNRLLISLNHSARPKMAFPLVAESVRNDKATSSHFTPALVIMLINKQDCTTGYCHTITIF